MDFGALQQQLMQDPEVMALLQKPGVMQKLQQLMANPAAAAGMMNDPDVMLLMSKLQGMGMGGGGGPAAAPPPAVAESKNVVHIRSSEELASLIAEASAARRLVVVDFSASWCGPCKRIAPTFSMLADKYHEDAVFCKVDGDECKALCAEKGIEGFPTFHFYVNGQLVHQFSGANDGELQSSVADWVAELRREPPSPYKHIPLRENEQVTFKTCKWEAVLASLTKNNAAVAADVKLSDVEVKEFESMTATLGNKFQYHSTSFSAAQMGVLRKMLVQWPVGNVAPALHMANMITRHPDGAVQVADADGYADMFVSRLCHVAVHAPKPTIALVAVRALTNMFSRRRTALAITARCEQVFDELAPLSEASGDERVRAALAGLLVNFAILFREKDKYDEAKIHALSLVSDFLSHESNPKIVYQVLVVLGTLIYRDEACKELAAGLDVAATVRARVVDKTKNGQQVVEAATEILKEGGW